MVVALILAGVAGLVALTAMLWRADQRVTQRQDGGDGAVVPASDTGGVSSDCGAGGDGGCGGD